MHLAEAASAGRKASTDRLPEFSVPDLIGYKVDLVVTYGSEGALAAKRSITTVPVVADPVVGDFVGAGVVRVLLPKPEANVTGF